MTVLLVAEHLHGAMKPATSQAVTALKKLGAPIEVLVAGTQTQKVASECSKLEGVSKVITLESEDLSFEAPEVLGKLVADLADKYSHIFFVSSSLGKAAMPRTAALLGLSPVSDVLDILGENSFVRAIYAGSIISQIEVDEPKIIATLRTSSFAVVATTGVAPIEECSIAITASKVRFVKHEETKSDRPELVSAKIVVAGGNGLTESGFEALTKLADKLGAAVGGTRTAVDNGLCPNDWQIGQTGKIIAPDLYICVGISGAIQHTAGIKDAKVIVAVNTDEDAPIFEVSDYGLIADGQETIDALIQKL